MGHGVTASVTRGETQGGLRMRRWVNEQRALLISAVFIGLCFIWMATLALTAGLVMSSSGAVYETQEQFVTTLGGAGFGAVSVAQVGGFAAIALGLAAMLGADGRLSRPLPRELRERLYKSFPLRSPDRAQIGIALMGGLTIWIFPSWIAQQLLALTAEGSSSPEILAGLLLSGSWLDRAVMIAAIVISAPILEELVFRGFLWRVTAQGFGWAGALALTTASFALTHLDPVQSVALIPTALFLGWLRYTSRDLLPPMVLHLVNNVAGVCITTFGPREEVTIPLWVALLGLVSTLGWSWAALRTSVSRTSV